jgi:phosphatidylglycerol:prolipoprotein diacylglycerol transferase
MFPAREIEAVCLFALFFVFSFKLRKNRFRLYLLCYSVLRFFLEFGRGDYRGAFLIHSLSPAQVTSVIVWIFLLVSATAPKWKGRENSGNCQG